MTKSFKKSVLLSLVVLLSVPHTTIDAKNKDNGLGTFLSWAGGAIIGGLIGVAAYNAFSSPTDSQELSSGQCLLNDAHNLQTKYASRYHKNCSYLLGSRPSIDQLKYSILHSESKKYPYIKYASKLSNDISSTRDMINNLCNKKNHLFKRKMELAHPSDTMSRDERSDYTKQYDKLIDQIARQIDTLQAMSNDLQNLETTIVGLPEYREEKLLEQINNLEDKIDHMNHQVYVWQPAPATPYWSKPVPVHEPAAIILQSNINVVEAAPAACPSSSSWGFEVEYNQSFS